MELSCCCCCCCLAKIVDVGRGSVQLTKQEESWRYAREGETTLFSFWDFYLFKEVFLFMHWSLPNALKPKMHFGFNDLNDLKDLFEQIVGYKTWKVTQSRSFLRPPSWKNYFPKQGCFSELLLPPFTTSMKVLSLSSIPLVLVKNFRIGVPYFL